MSTEWIHRVFLSATITVVVAVLVALISGCSVYKSNGRKTFEDRAPGNLKTTLVGQSEEAEDTCWTQPAKDPLWETPSDQELRVRALNTEILEVCVVSTN